MSATDVAVSADEIKSPPETGSTATDEKLERPEPVDRVKKDSADTEKKGDDEWNKRPVGLIDLMR